MYSLQQLATRLSSPCKAMAIHAMRFSIELASTVTQKRGRRASGSPTCLHLSQTFCSTHHSSVITTWIDPSEERLRHSNRREGYLQVGPMRGRHNSPGRNWGIDLDLGHGRDVDRLITPDSRARPRPKAAPRKQHSAPDITVAVRKEGRPPSLNQSVLR